MDRRTKAKPTDLIWSWFFVILFFLWGLSLYVNQAPHNLITGLAALFSLIFIVFHLEKTLIFLKTHRAFFIPLALYFCLYLLINAYHFNFSWSADHAYAVKRSRWILLSLLFLPTLGVLGQDTRTRTLITKLFPYFLIIFFILSGLIFFDSIYKVFFHQPSTSLWFKSSSAYQDFGLRAAWTYNPIPFSKITFFASLFLGGLFLTTSRSSVKLTCLLLSSGFLLTTLLTQTRATWLAMAFVFPFFFYFIKPARLPSLLAIMALGLYIIFVPQNFLKTRLQTVTQSGNFSNVYRIEHWKANLKLSLDHPLLGVGYANNRKESVLKDYIHPFTTNKELLYGHPHNEYLDVLSGMGFITLFLFIYLLLYPFLVFLRTPTTLFSALSVIYLLLVLFTAFFDKITLTTWSSVIFSWALLLKLPSEKS